MNTLVENLQTLFANFKAEAEKNLKGNKAAGTRARKTSLEIAKKLKEFRAESIKACKSED